MHKRHRRMRARIVGILASSPERKCVYSTIRNVFGGGTPKELLEEVLSDMFAEGLIQRTHERIGPRKKSAQFITLLKIPEE